MLVIAGAALLVLTLAAVASGAGRRRSVAWGNVAASLLWIAAMVLAIPVHERLSRRPAVVVPARCGLVGRVAVESLRSLARVAPA